MQQLKRHIYWNIDDFEQKILTHYLFIKGLDYYRFITNFYSDIPQFLPPHLFSSQRELTIWDIIGQFEITIDGIYRKLNGAVSTPLFVVDYINKKVILENDAKNIKVIDPACGSGIFLVDALLKLKEKTGRSYKELVENNIYGIDIDPRAIKRTKILLSLIVFENEGEIPSKFNIYRGNSLDKSFLKACLKEEKFQAVVGNPPYVRIQNLEDATKDVIRRYWKFVQGDTDIFIPFIELGIELIAEDGKMGYITPNSYLTSYAGKELRKFLQLNTLVEEILDFDYYQVFKGITTYTAITIISKRKKNYFIFKKLKDPNQIADLESVKGEKVYFTELNPTKWILVPSENKELIRIIENAYYKLKDIADVRVGLATLADEVYIIENPVEQGGFFVKIFKGKKFLIEKEITKEVIKASIIKTEEDIRKNNRRIIFPYKKLNGKFVILSEEELKFEYPRTYEYFLFCKDILLKRDKGKKKYETWFAFGRTQGINTTFGEKILTPPMALKPTFVVCEKKDATFYSGYGIFPKVEPFTDLHLLKKILNSKLTKLYIENTAKSYKGGWKSYSKTFLMNLGLPKLTKEQIKFLKKETDQTAIDKFLEDIYYEQSKNKFERLF